MKKLEIQKFKELSSVVANQRQRVKIVETGETRCS